MLAQLASITTLLLFASTGFTNVVAKTNYNTKAVNSLKTSATSYPEGSYKITNVATGESLQFTHVETKSDTIQNIYPTSDSSTSVNLKQLGGGGENYMRLSVKTDNGKDQEYCFSAQWGTGGDGDGVDHAAVLYTCTSPTLEKNKQKWFLIPANSSSDSKHKRRINGGHKTGHGLAKRKSKSSGISSGSTFFIIPTDHLNDMQPLALSGKKVSGAGGASGVMLAPLDQTDKKQEWKLTKSS